MTYVYTVWNLEGECDSLHSVYATREGAERALDRLNTPYRERARQYFPNGPINTYWPYSIETYELLP